MKPQNLHVFFRRVAKGTFLQSEALDPAAIRLICLEETLTIGPLLGIDSEEAFERRKKWWLEVFEDPVHPVEEWVDGMIENDRKAISSILENPEKIDAIYLWTGYCADEILSAARFVFHVAKLGKPMFQINFPNIPVRIWNGDIIYPESLVVVDPKHVDELVDHFILLSDKDIEAYCRIWERAVSTDSLLRIRDRLTARKIAHERVDHFDHFLLSHCTDEFRTAARVIGETFADVEMGVGDGFLNWRLKQLCRDAKLAYRGELNAIRDYEVKKTTV